MKGGIGRKKLFGFLVIAGVLALVAGCGGGRGPAAEATATAGVPATLPDVTLNDLDGNSFSMADTAGKVRLVDFWATWCAPCREEIPMFKELTSKYRDQGFQIIAISMDEEGADVVRPFVDRYDLPYANLIGNDDVAKAFGGVYGLPTAFLVDRQGKIVESFVGPKPQKVLEGKIRELLGAEPAA